MYNTYEKSICNICGKRFSSKFANKISKIPTGLNLAFEFCSRCSFSDLFYTCAYVLDGGEKTIY